MAIKVQGSTIIDDSRNIINATQVGIATTTTSQSFQVGSGTTIVVVNNLGNLGIGTINPTSKLTVVGDVLVSGIVTAASFRGDGSQLFGVSDGVSISTNTTNQNQFLTYAISTGTTTGLGVTTSGLVFNPSTTRFGIGITNPQYTFTVTDTGTPATTGLTNCLADFTTTANSYGQINLRNTSTGTNASSDVIITTDNGNDSTNFIDLGINNSGFSVGSWTINGANDGYLYTSDGNLSIGAINASVAKYISFFTGGTLLSNERMRINSTGVGIGTTNPTSKLTVVGNALFTGDNLGINTSSSTARLSVASTTGDSLLQVADNVASGSMFRVNSSTGYTLMDIDGDGTVLFTTTGNVGIGTTITSPTNKLEVGGSARIYGSLVDSLGATGTSGQVLQSVGTGISWVTFSSGSVTVSDDTSTNATRYPIFEDVTSGNSTTINVSSTKLTFNPSTGTLSATVFTSLSDANKKTNIRPIENAIEITKKLEGVRFDWIDSGAPSIGVIAQEVEKVLPELVVESDGTKSVSYGNIIGVLIEAIKEQQVRIEELERKLDA